MEARRNLGRWLLYFGCLATALGALGYYWLEYIPSQREYFLNLRFRVLATMGDQFRSKLAGLSNSLYYAAQPGGSRLRSTFPRWCPF